MAEPKTISLGQGAFWSMLDNVVQQLLSFAVFLVLARLVSPDDFGLIAIAHVMVIFVRQTLFDAIAHPVARAAAPDDRLYSRAFTVCLMLAVFMAGVMWLVAQPIARFYQQPALQSVLHWMPVVILATGAAAIFEARLIRSMRFKPLAIRSLCSVCIGGAAGLYWAFQGWGVMALVGQQVVTSCLALVLLVVQSDWRPRLVLRGLELRQFVADGFKVGSTNLLNFLATQGDTLLVSLTLGSHATGIYNFAKRLASAIYLVIGTSFSKLAYASFSEVRGQPGPLRAAYLRLLCLTLFFLVPMLVGLGSVADPMVALLFGEQWAAAVPVMGWLAAFYLLLSLNQLNDHVLFIEGLGHFPARRALVQMVLVLVAGWVGSFWGIAWTAAAFVLGAFVLYPWSQRLVNRSMQLSLREWIRAIFPILIGVAGMVCAVSACRHLPVPVVWQLACAVLFGALAYLILYAVTVKRIPESPKVWNVLWASRLGRTKGSN